MNWYKAWYSAVSRSRKWADFYLDNAQFWARLSAEQNEFLFVLSTRYHEKAIRCIRRLEKAKRK